jgi:LCCL domain
LTRLDGSEAARHDRRWRAARPSVALGVLVLALAGASGSAARTAAVEPTPTGSNWYDNAVVIRGKTGTFEYVCAGGGRLDQVWGSAPIFADNSTVCSAAVQAGLITEVDGGIVTVQPAPGQASYTGTAANGVTSSSLSQWPGSFKITAAVKGGGTPGVKLGGGAANSWAVPYRGENGQKVLYICPGGMPIQTVYGTNTYTDDSPPCTAAVQVGLITQKNGGRVTVVIGPGQSSYASFTANGVESRSSGPTPGSYSFAGAAPIPGSPGAGGGGGTTTTNAPIPPPTATTTGTVLVNGVPFTGGTIKFGATVDLTHGSVSLKATTGTVKLTAAGGATAAFVLARGTANKKQVVVFKLAKGDFSACPKRSTKSARAGGQSKVVRQLWGNGHGNFETKGRYAAATVRGTDWLTADRCDGTLTKVVRGVVQVNDLPKHKTVSVTAGHSYLAKP